MTVDLSPKTNLKPAEQEMSREYVVGERPLGESMGGLQMFSNTFKRGYGDKVFGSDENGIWLGAADFADAPFKVDMDGNLTTTGYIAVGGAADDVNSGDTEVEGSKLKPGTVTADYVVASISISSPTITGGTIAIGSGNSIFKADANGIYLGNASFASAPFRVNMSGQVTASSLTLTNAAIGAGSSYTGNQIANAYIGELSASKITSDSMSANRISGGTLTLGGNNNGNGTMIVNNSSGTEIVRINNQGVIFSQSAGTSSIVFVNSYGGTMYGYLGYDSGNNRMTLASTNGKAFWIGSGGNIVLAPNGVVSAGNISCSNMQTGYIESSSYINASSFSSSSGAISLGGKTLAVYDWWFTSDNDGSGRARLRWENGANFSVDASGSWFHVNGYDKSAIVPTSQGYRALYCAEAPEVWFFDFCESKKEIDPLFLEVTEGKMKFIKVEGGGYQVWRRRKGHGGKRFEAKTSQEFMANERFLSLAKGGL